MWKKILVSFVLMIAVLTGLYTWKTKTSQPIYMTNAAPQIKPQRFEDQTYNYTADNLSDTCTLNSEMACAVDFAVKCTLNPEHQGCRESKLPKFIFMSDESLKRPTEMSFKIVKIKPINPDLIEIHTDGACNGNWFGLCQGRIIYVLVPSNNSWRVKDIYAIEI